LNLTDHAGEGKQSRLHSANANLSQVGVFTFRRVRK
jgi:hypothetical protein